LAQRLWVAVAALVCASSWLGCPADPMDAPVDAFRVRRDSGPLPDDAAGLDAAGLDAAGLDAAGPDARSGPVDAGSFDAGPVVQCEGVPAPPVPCTRDDDCAAAGLLRCNLPIPGVVCGPCMGLVNECLSDLDCFERATGDAGPEFFVDAWFGDAGVIGEAGIPEAGLIEAGPVEVGPRVDAGDPSRLVCNTYGARCACPRRVCEPRCTGPTCATARCDTDGYACPANMACLPSSPTADDHGCAARPCTTTADCDCGFCTPMGLCANGAGTCE
jgi:hypothetical protein